MYEHNQQWTKVCICIYNCKEVKTCELFFFWPTTKMNTKTSLSPLSHFPLMTCCVRCLLMDSWFWILNNQSTHSKAHFLLAQWIILMFFIDILLKGPSIARIFSLLLYSSSCIGSFKVKTCLSELWLAHLALPGQSRFPKKFSCACKITCANPVVFKLQTSFCFCEWTDTVLHAYFAHLTGTCAFCFVAGESLMSCLFCFF